MEIWKQIPEICGMLCIFLGCIGAVRGMVSGIETYRWIQSFMISVSFGLGIFMVDKLFCFTHMERMIRINLIHFIENVLPNRMDKKEQKQNSRQQEHIKKEKESADRISNHWEQIASARELNLTQEDIQTLKDFINDL